MDSETKPPMTTAQPTSDEYALARSLGEAVRELNRLAYRAAALGLDVEFSIVESRMHAGPKTGVVDVKVAKPMPVYE